MLPTERWKERQIKERSLTINFISVTTKISGTQMKRVSMHRFTELEIKERQCFAIKGTINEQKPNAIYKS